MHDDRTGLDNVERKHGVFSRGSHMTSQQLRKNKIVCRQLLESGGQLLESNVQAAVVGKKFMLLECQEKELRLFRMGKGQKSSSMQELSRY